MSAPVRGGRRHGAGRPGPCLSGQDARASRPNPRHHDVGTNTTSTKRAGTVLIRARSRLNSTHLESTGPPLAAARRRPLKTEMLGLESRPEAPWRREEDRPTLPFLSVSPALVKPKKRAQQSQHYRPGQFRRGGADRCAHTDPPGLVGAATGAALCREFRGTTANRRHRRACSDSAPRTRDMSVGSCRARATVSCFAGSAVMDGARRAAIAPARGAPADARASVGKPHRGADLRAANGALGPARTERPSARTERSPRSLGERHDWVRRGVRLHGCDRGDPADERRAGCWGEPGGARGAGAERRERGGRHDRKPGGRADLRATRTGPAQAESPWALDGEAAATGRADLRKAMGTGPNGETATIASHVEAQTRERRFASREREAVNREGAPRHHLRVIRVGAVGPAPDRSLRTGVARSMPGVWFLGASARLC